MDTTVERVDGPALKPSQEKFLDGMLAGKGFSELTRDLAMTKANGALLLEALRSRGLVVREPSMPNRRRVVSELDKAGAVLWWDYPLKDVPGPKRLDPRYTGKGRWSCVAVPITRHERADLRPDRWMVAVTAPWGEFAFIASDRDRLSYYQVNDEMTMAHAAVSADLPADWEATVRVVTESVADAMGVESVLPVQFIREQEAEANGDDTNDVGAEDAGTGGGKGSS